VERHLQRYLEYKDDDLSMRFVLAGVLYEQKSWPRRSRRWRCAAARPGLCGRRRPARSHQQPHLFLTEVSCIASRSSSSCWPRSLQAANMAIGYIDSERILLESQDAIEAQKLFETESQAWDAQVADIERDIARLQEEYENKRLVLTDTGRAEAQQKIADKKAELDTLINSIYGENGLASQKTRSCWSR
jgi:Skp family chaperone for outer membrane proteins